MAARRNEGATYLSIAREFGTSYEAARRVITNVDHYDRGVQILRNNPAALEGLELMGVLHPLAASSLYARGYRTLHDLGSLTLVDLLVMPNISCKDAELLVRLVAEPKAVGNVKNNSPELLDAT
jgi:hypothetical protein